MDKARQIRDYYDTEYYSPSARRQQPDTHRIRRQMAGFPLQKGMRVLDVGCGQGPVLFFLSQAGAEPFGVDISRTALKDARAAVGARAAVADAQALPFRSASLEGATFMGTLEHFPDPEAALGEASRVTGPEAPFLLVVPNLTFPLFRFLGGTGQAYEEPRTLEGWLRLFGRCGLTVERVGRDPGPSLSQGISARSLLRKAVLLAFSVLPLRFTYQFVFLCRKSASPPRIEGADGR